MESEVYRFGQFLNTVTYEDGNTLYTNPKTGFSSYNPLEAAVGKEKFAEISAGMATDILSLAENIAEEMYNEKHETHKTEYDAQKSK